MRFRGSTDLDSRARVVLETGLTVNVPNTGVPEVYIIGTREKTPQERYRSPEPYISVVLIEPTHKQIARLRELGYKPIPENTQE